MKQVILAAKRSAIGTFLGVFKDVDAVSLGAEVAKALTQDFSGTDFADVIVGNVPQVGQGMNSRLMFNRAAMFSAVIPM